MEKVFFSSEGEGEALVLVHGFCEDSRVWGAIAPQLAKNNRLVLIDMPGFGSTPLDAGKSPETIEDIADRIAYTLQSEGINRSILIGHSMGGYVALALAERHPQLLNAFGLFHSTAYSDTDEKKQNRLKQADFVKNKGVKPFVETLIPGLFAKSFEHESQLKESLIWAKECKAEGIINALLAMRQRPERIEVLKNSRVPILIIAGQEDEIIPVEKLSYQASLPARCQFELFEKSGHMGMTEEPEKSIDVIKSFLEFVSNS